jgi:tetratricopeptide (TPR) repeat protein
MNGLLQSRSHSHDKAKMLLPSIQQKSSVKNIKISSRKVSHRASKSQINIFPKDDDPKLILAKSMAASIVDIHGELNEKMKLASKMIDLAMEYFKKKQYESIILIMDEVEANCLTARTRDLTTAFYKAYATILLQLSEYSKSIVISKRLVSESMRNQDLKSLLFAYELMGQTYSQSKLFEESLRNYFYMLKVALKTRNYKKELVAYDKIGMQYFNLNQLDRSEYFHTKMLEGKIEPEESNKRNMEIIPDSIPRLDANIATSTTEVEVQEIDELAMVFFEPMAVDPKYRELDEKKKKVFEYMDKQKNPIRRVGNVMVFGSSPQQIKITRSGYTLKPTNSPISTLAHLSANRSVKIFDAISSREGKDGFRFLKFGKQFEPYNRKMVWTALTDLKMHLISYHAKLIRTDGGSTQLNNPFANLINFPVSQ